LNYSIQLNMHKNNPKNTTSRKFTATLQKN
jgi:hypothetical protein